MSTKEIKSLTQGHRAVFKTRCGKSVIRLLGQYSVHGAEFMDHEWKCVHRFAGDNQTRRRKNGME